MKMNVIGRLTKVSEVEVKETYKFQNIQITQSGYDQNTGEPKQPEIYEATIFNKKVDEIKAADFLNKQVVATCWTRSIPKEYNGSTFYNIALNCSAIKEA